MLHHNLAHGHAGHALAHHAAPMHHSITHGAHHIGHHASIPHHRLALHHKKAAAAPKKDKKNLKLENLFDIDDIRAGAGHKNVRHHPFRHQVGLGIAAHNSHDGGLLRGLNLDINLPAPPHLQGLDDTVMDIGKGHMELMHADRLHPAYENPVENHDYETQLQADSHLHLATPFADVAHPSYYSHYAAGVAHPAYDGVNFYGHAVPLTGPHHAYP